MRYVIGYMFNRDRTLVALIFKRRGPQEVVGRFNGIGGKLEPGESLTEGMVREFFEETGKATTEDMWKHVARFETRGHECFVFVGQCNDIHSVRTMEEEEVQIFHVLQLPHTNQQTKWCIGLCLDPGIVNGTYSVHAGAAVGR